MIYVKIEIWPGGSKERARLLGEGFIANRSGVAGPIGDYNTAFIDRELSDEKYDVKLMKSPEYSKRINEPWKRGEVVNFPRRRLGPWDLLFRALAATVAGRNPGVDPKTQ